MRRAGRAIFAEDDQQKEKGELAFYFASSPSFFVGSDQPTLFKCQDKHFI
jgi:hypothetical protein